MQPPHPRPLSPDYGGEGRNEGGAKRGKADIIPSFSLRGIPWASSKPTSIVTARARIIKSAWCAASSATCRWTNGSSSSQDAGFDGWEEASWELDLAKCDTDAGAEAYAKERVDLAKKHGLEIFTVATHLQGQALGDEPSAKTLQFIGGEAVEAYKAWRDKGNKPPRTDPYYVPDEVGKLIHQQGAARPDAPASAWRITSASCRIARSRCPASSARRPIAGAISSCSRRCPTSIGGHAIPDVRQVSLELLVERFGPVWDACKKYGVTFDLECHPSERAMGDIESASDYINHMCKAGYEGVVGFNLDGSHMEWQGVVGRAVHPRVRRVHPLRPHQGRAGEPRAHPRRPAGRPSADGPSAQRLELRHRRARPATPTAARRSSSS